MNVSEERLPACKQCYASLMKKLTGEFTHGGNDTQCNKCANWSFVRAEDGITKEECMNDAVSKDYPKEYRRRPTA